MSSTTTTTTAGPFPALAPVLTIHPLLGQLARFALASGLATAINIAVYLVMRTWWDAVPANLVALILGTALSNELNRRFTFGHAGPRRWAYYAQTVATVVFYAVYSSAVLLVLHAAVTETVPVEESMAVTAASLLGGGLRFVVLRRWVFRPSLPVGRRRGAHAGGIHGCSGGAQRSR